MNRPTRRPDRPSKARLALRVEPLEGRLLLTTYVVTSDASSGLGSLAAAITLSNADTTQPNTIDFDEPDNGIPTIALTSPLPPVTQDVNIDGSSNPNSTTVNLDGTNAGAGSPGLVIASTAGDSTVQGLNIEKFRGDGLDVLAGGVTVENDQIGNDGDGLSVQGAAGVSISHVFVNSNSGYGLILESAPNATLTNVQVDSTLARGQEPGDGFRIDHSVGVMMTETVAASNAGIGVNISDSNGLNLYDSRIESNAGGGLAIVDSGGNLPSTISEAMIGREDIFEYGNGVVGMLISNSPALTLNTDQIVGSAGPGLVINAGSAATVAAPTITSLVVLDNAGDGVDVNAATGLGLASSSIEGNGGVGLFLANGSGAATIQGTAIGVSRLTDKANAGVGLLVLGSDHASITGTTVEGSAGFGIELFRSDFARLTNVSVSGTTASGADLGDGILSVLSRSITLTDPTVFANAGIGINIDQSDSTTIEGAMVSLNLIGGVDLDESYLGRINDSTIGGSAVGVFVAGSIQSQLVNDVVEENTGNGIRVAFGSANATISQSTVSDNDGSGIVISASATSVGGVHVDGNKRAGVVIDYAPGSGIIGSSVGTLAPNLGDGIDVLDSDGVTVGSADSIYDGNQVFAPKGAGIVVQGSAMATIDLNTVTSSGGDGIVAFGDNGVVLDGDTVARSADNGINILGDAGSTVELAKLSDNGGAGLLAADSNDLLLNGDTATGNLGGGVEVRSSDRMRVGFSNLDGNSLFGLEVSDSVDVVIGGTYGPNEVSGTLNTEIYSEAVHLVDLTGPMISDLTSTANQGDGIEILNGIGGTITATTIGGATANLGNSGRGLLIARSSGLRVGATGAAVVSENNGSIGIQVNFSPNPVLTNLTVESNKDAGVELIGSVGLSLTGSTIEHQGNDGLVVTNGSDNATISGNTISGNTPQNIVVTDSRNFVNND